MDDVPYRDIFENEEQVKDFYRLLREGHVASTSRVSMVELERQARLILDAGFDLMFIGFSGGLSSSTSAAIETLEKLRPNYPDRKMALIDSLCPSGGFALLLHYTVQHQEAGESIEQVAKWVTDNRLHVAHWFTVDDLMFLHRGGRVSKASAIAGTVIGVKPVLHVDNEGHLIMVEKAKSRRKSMKALCDHMEATALQPVADQTVYINHGDCIEDAKILGKMVEDRFGVTDLTYLYTTPVIAAHSGPGTLSVFFMASAR